MINAALQAAQSLHFNVCPLEFSHKCSAHVEILPET
jgi:hypothetical protein